MSCKHENFVANVTVNRIGEGDEPIGEVKGFMADVKINCADCGLPFEFMGFDCGLSWSKPMVNPSAQEIRIPIRPKGSKILPALPGFEAYAN